MRSQNPERTGDPVLFSASLGPEEDWSEPPVQEHTFKPVGMIHTPFTDRSQAPRSTHAAGEAEGVVEVFEAYAAGLGGLEGWERIWLLWSPDRIEQGKLIVQPPFNTGPKGVFSTRSPSRPNPIALSCVRLLGIDGRRLRVADVDMLDGTPLLDIKPYSRRTDCFPGCRCGWFDEQS